MNRLKNSENGYAYLHIVGDSNNYKFFVTLGERIITVIICYLTIMENFIVGFSRTNYDCQVKEKFQFNLE